jgi:hypothetical protein
MGFHMIHLTSEFHRVHSKWFLKPMVRLAQIMHLSCTYTNPVSKRAETRFHMIHVTKGFHQVRPKWFLSLWFIWCKPCTYLAPTLTLSRNGLKQDSTWPRYLVDPPDASKIIFEPMVCSTQTMHLSCIKISTISKQIESSFHLSLVT